MACGAAGIPANQTVVVLRDDVTPGMMSSQPMTLRGFRETINAPAKVNTKAPKSTEIHWEAFGPPGSAEEASR